MTAVATVVGFTAAAQGKADKGSAKQSAAAAATQHKVVMASEVTWADVPPGAKMAVLDGDPTKKGSFTVRLQSPDGYRIGPHTHPSPERITVLSGTFHLGMGGKFDEASARELGPGSFAVLPTGMQHFGWVTGETGIQIHSEGPFAIKYVNPGRSAQRQEVRKLNQTESQ